MSSQIIELNAQDWALADIDEAGKGAAVQALEAGKVLHFPALGFELSEPEKRFLTPAVRDPKARNISLDAQGGLKGALGDAAARAELAQMIGRFRAQAQTLIHALVPHY